MNTNTGVNDSQNSPSTSNSKNSDSKNSQGSSTVKPSEKNAKMSKPESSTNQTETSKCSKTDNPSTSSSSDAQTKPSLKRKIEDFFNVVAPKGRMKEKHERAAPYFMFFTTISSAPETHTHPLSITFQELLDPSLGKLKSSLQINFMVDVGWLLAQYYFADYSDKPLTILYGDDSEDLKAVNQKKRNIEAHLVPMKNAFGKHHTKMGIYHYEDESIRVVVSTANLYIDDWENRTQGLWLSPRCPRLADPYDVVNGESPTGFKRSLINYLNSYSMPCLSMYLQIVKNIDFSAINVFFVASIPGGHFDTQWGLSRIGNLLSQHCVIPPDEADQWTLIAQASSIGSFGNDPKLWLCGDFQQNFCRSFKSSPMVTRPPQLKFIYPSLTNVKNSHDNLLGGGCLPYSNSIHVKQPWLNNYLQEWSAVHSGRNRAMPHIKSYLRMSPDSKRAPFFLLTSGNISKSAWGTFNKGNRALRINSYEVGVLFIPKFVVNKDFFSLELSDSDRLPVPYDLPPIPYESGEVPWVMDYLS
ncbi:tyrosyl-DNA phosphodiesterase 1-like isoform X2 [Arctopsyche grandis]